MNSLTQNRLLFYFNACKIANKVLQNTKTNSVILHASSVDFFCSYTSDMGKMNLSVKTVARSVRRVLNILPTPFKGFQLTGVIL